MKIKIIWIKSEGERRRGVSIFQKNLELIKGINYSFGKSIWDIVRNLLFGYTSPNPKFIKNYSGSWSWFIITASSIFSAQHPTQPLHIFCACFLLHIPIPLVVICIPRHNNKIYKAKLVDRNFHLPWFFTAYQIIFTAFMRL